MAGALAAFQWLVTGGFVLLGLLSLSGWLRQRGQGHAYLAAAIGLLAVVSLSSRVNPATANGFAQLTTPVAVILFMASGYALLLFRSTFFPLRPRTRAIVAGLAAASTVFFLLFAPPPGTVRMAPVQSIALVSLILVWSGMVGEPVLRFWLASRGRPAVQQGRLRLLSVGFAAIIFILVVAGAGGTRLNASLAVQFGLQALALISIPLIYASFAPPGWLKRTWREPEEAAFRRAVRELLLFSPDCTTLAERALDWGLRIIGADGGAILDGTDILAIREIRPELARQLASDVHGTADARVYRLDKASQNAVVVPLALDKGGGAIAAVSNAFMPPFGSDEVLRLEEFGTNITAGLDRVRIAERMAELEKTKAEGVLQETAAHVRAVLENVADGIITTDESGMIEFFNRAAQRLFGYPLAEVHGQDAKMLMAEPYRDDFVSHLNNYWRPGKSQVSVSGSRELWGQRKDGSTFPMEFRVSEILMGGDRRFLAILHDISEQRAQKDALEYQALHDPLTGLPNRTLFNDRLRQAIVVWQRERAPVVLLIMDMDRFKEVNDTLGHHIGDLLLQQVALRLAATLRQSDTVARLGGDEFAVLPAGGTDLRGGSQAAKKILHALEQPFVVDGRNIDVRASIGIALCPEHGEEAETLMRHADVAMYVAKRTKRGSAIYAPQHDEHTAAHLALIGELRHAVGHDELVLHYQPTVALDSGRTVGVEALVRWQHPKRGLMPPDQFVPAAEETELVQPLGRWVLNQGLCQLRSWADTGLEIELAVNLSVWNLRDPDFPDMASDLLETWRVEPARLKLEITESSIMAHSAIETITRLSALGVGLSIDDFGTGYSSLAYLKRLPVNEIKIDKSFIIGMMGDSASVSIVRSIIELGHNMGLQVVAEGVENRETWDWLGTLGCDLAQGNYLCPPIPPADLTRWLRESTRDLGEAIRIGASSSRPT